MNSSHKISNLKKQTKSLAISVLNLTLNNNKYMEPIFYICLSIFFIFYFWVGWGLGGVVHISNEKNVATVYWGPKSPNLAIYAQLIGFEGSYFPFNPILKTKTFLTS